MIARLLRKQEKSQRPAGVVPADKARKLILRATDMRELAGLQVSGHLDLANQPQLSELPAGLVADSLDVSGCVGLQALPERLQVRRLNLSGCTGLQELPAGLRCWQLELRGTPISKLPDDLQVEFCLDLEGCVLLTSLPQALKVGKLVLRDCVALTALPEGLEVCFLDISGCTGLATWPQTGALRFGRLVARGCWQLTALPPWISELAQLDIAGCTGLTAIPEDLEISSWLDLADSGIQELPAALGGVRLRWKGVPIDERIAFRPETITAEEVLEETNLELRRVLLERMGYEAFLTQAQAEVLDRDRDAGGERRLLKVRLARDEDLVCVAVICPSTGRQYMLRVPPRMRTCRQAVAWIAGFDNPNDYKPIFES